MNAKVSIGICAKDAESTISLAIESAINQDYDHKQMEIVLVNDGSKDRTLQIMRDFASKIDIQTRIFSEGWRGIAKARNTVVNNASGDYIVWLDSDEILDRDYVRKQVHLLEQNPTAGIAMANVAIHPDDNVVLILDKLPIISEYRYKKRERPFKMPGTGGTTYRTTAIRAVGGFNEMLYGSCEDIDAAYKMKQVGWKIVNGDSVVHESHGGSLTLKKLWIRSFKRGVESRHLHDKKSIFFSAYRMNPLASFVNGLRYAFLSFFSTKRLISFALPFFYSYKMTAWYCGFTKRAKSI